MASPSRQHAVDIDELSTFIERKLHMLPSLSSETCIYRAPIRLRLSSEQYFMPRILSIGPIHYRNEKLSKNEHLKQRLLSDFQKLTLVSLKDCYKLILDKERRLRNCYEGIIELNSETFVNMVLVDAAFLLMMLVYSSCGSNLMSSIDQVFEKPVLVSDLIYDLLLLENQLPFFILEDLYELSKLHSILKSMLEPNFSDETAMTFFAHIFLRIFPSQIVPQQPPPFKPKHILDLYRSYFIPADWDPPRERTEITNMPSMKKLYQAGVKIQVGSRENMFDIRFNRGKLEIPPLIISDSTELLFRNLLSYELCHFPKSHIFSDYLEMIRQFTLTSEDTELLVKNGVIINGLQNTKQVSKLFQNIGAGNIVNWSEFLYSDVIEWLNIYYNNCWNRWKATLEEKYFSVAVLLLVLTIIQTTFTVLQVVLPK